MNSPFRDLFSGLMGPRRALVGSTTPRRTFDDVVLPAATYRALNQALAQIRHHNLIFEKWGLGERHDTGLGLAFNFAGPPGTGKTICAEAIANAVGKRLLVVRYSEMESMWVGETGKNVASVFRLANEQDAVLFFDEADAIASRRFTSIEQGNQREMNTVVNVLLRELDEFGGVVIFATNLAANFDPAFERRIRNHILFERPGVAEREMIWRVQIHPDRTPLAPDVDFRALAERFDATGGDIKNAVVKAAQMAADEPGEDSSKRLHQRHLESAIQDVLAAKRVMDQSLFAEGGFADSPATAIAGMAGHQTVLEDNLSDLAARVVQLEDEGREIGTGLDQLRDQLLNDRQTVAAAEQERARAIAMVQDLTSNLTALERDSQEAAALVHSVITLQRRLLWLVVAAVIVAVAAIMVALLV